MAGTKPSGRLPSGFGSLSIHASESVIIRSGLVVFMARLAASRGNDPDTGGQYLTLIGKRLARGDDAQFGQGVISCCGHGVYLPGQLIRWQFNSADGVEAAHILLVLVLRGPRNASR